MPPIRSRPPSGGPIVTPRFCATRTDAYAASCRSGATRSATIAWSAAPPSEPKAGSSASSVRPAQLVVRRRAAGRAARAPGSPSRSGSAAAGRCGPRRARRRSRWRLRGRRRPGRPSPRALCEACSSLIAQMPRNGKSAEPAIEPVRPTASTGRSARSTSPPQTRRKMRAKSVMDSACEGGAREEPERRLDRGADQRREDNGTDPDVTSQCETRKQHGRLDQRPDPAEPERPSGARRRASGSRAGLRRGPRRCRGPSRRRTAPAPPRAGRSGRPGRGRAPRGW